MAKVGDTVHIESWDSTSGFAIDEYKLVEIRPDCLLLRHVGTYQKCGKVAGSQKTVEKTKTLLERIDRPIDERLRHLRAEIDFLQDAFSPQVPRVAIPPE